MNDKYGRIFSGKIDRKFSSVIIACVGNNKVVFVGADEAMIHTSVVLLKKMV